MKRLASFLPEGSMRYLPITAILNKEVTIHGFTVKDGKFGQFAVMDVTVDAKRVKVATGSSIVLTALQNVEEQQAFPVGATFKKDGQRIVIE